MTPLHSADFTHMTNWFTQAASHSSRCNTWCTHERSPKVSHQHIWTAHTTPDNWCNEWLHNNTCTVTSWGIKTRGIHFKDDFKVVQNVKGTNTSYHRNKTDEEKRKKKQGKWRKQQRLWSGEATHKVARWAPAEPQSSKRRQTHARVSCKSSTDGPKWL